MSSIKIFFEKISLSFTKNSAIAGFFFFLVLCSWYILRPVRNEMAVQNSDILPYLLGVGALVMLLLNPIEMMLLNWQVMLLLMQILRLIQLVQLMLV